MEHILGIDLQLNRSSLYQAPYDSRRMLKEGMDVAMDPFSIIGQTAADIKLIEDMCNTILNLSTTKDGSSRFAVDPTLRLKDVTLEALSVLSPSLMTADTILKGLALSGRPVAMIQQMSTSIHESLLAIAAQVDASARKAHGVHVNWWRAPQSGDRRYFSPDTYEEFRRTKHGWAKSNAFVSCCRLASNLCE